MIVAECREIIVIFDIIYTTRFKCFRHVLHVKQLSSAKFRNQDLYYKIIVNKYLS